jgi:hypothetical protein
MKGTRTSSSSDDVVLGKVRDDRYMRHLREVERISNREAEQLSRDIRSQLSITELHKKHKALALDWHQRQQQLLISLKNKQIQQKIVDIRPYTHFRPSSPFRTSAELPPPERSPSPGQLLKSKRFSLHYHYRKRQQEAIAREN